MRKKEKADAKENTKSPGRDKPERDQVKKGAD